MRGLGLLLVLLLVPAVGVARPGLRVEPRNQLIDRGQERQARGLALETRGEWLIGVGETTVGRRFVSEGQRLVNEGVELELRGEEIARRAAERADSHSPVGWALGLWSEEGQL